MKLFALHDKAQEIICSRLAYTEYMLTEVLKKFNNNFGRVEITALEDLGFPNNLSRMRGGFFTGITVKWESGIPFIPVDATVNSCGVSIFKYEDRIDFPDFQEKMNQLDQKLKCIGLVNNFTRGNHFLSFCSDAEGSQYLVLHASDNKYKFGEKGLYPREDTWYYNQMQTECFSGGYIRFLLGKPAETFYTLYLESEKENPIRNRAVAEIILEGCSNVEEVLYSPHYGMPDSSSIAIGSQWRRQNNVMLTNEGASIFVVKDSTPNMDSIPHGFGVTINGKCNSLSFTDRDVVINDIKFNCDKGFLDCPIAKTRYSDRVINRETICSFMPQRSICIINELKQRFSYTRNGIKSFE